MLFEFVKPLDLLPGDLIAFSVKSEKDGVSKLKYLSIDEISEDELDDGSPAISCHGSLFGQPREEKNGVRKSNTRKQRFKISDTPSILLLKRSR